jgi:hypothetical protein
MTMNGNDLFAFISKSGWAFAGFLLVLLAPLLARIVKEFLTARVQLREIEARNERQRIARGLDTSRTTAGPAPASKVVDANFDILEKYYNQTLAENRLLSRTAIGVALLGFFVILVGVGLAISGLTTIGTVSSVAGLLAEAATFMFFNQLREQVKQVQDYHKKLISTQYLMTSIALTKDLGGDRHDAEIIRIINNLLFLSNELHGSKSDHLFDHAALLIDNSNRENRGRLAAASVSDAGGGTATGFSNNPVIDVDTEPERQSCDPLPASELVQNS